RRCFENDENADGGKKRDDMGACIEKLDKVRWAAQDPMYDTTLLLFGQSADYKKLWLHLKLESCENWVKSVGKSANPLSLTLGANSFTLRKIEFKLLFENNGSVKSLVGSDNEIKEDEEDDDLEYFDTFPTREELEYHESILKILDPHGLKLRLEQGNLINIKISCMIVLEDTSGVADHYLRGMVLGKPFVKESGLVYDKDEGTVILNEESSEVLWIFT
nr:L10-interacting MYB domain-containing protein-like [Tanacetum cinerariifolium]